jgi:hypothetical protein
VKKKILLALASIILLIVIIQSSIKLFTSNLGSTQISETVKNNEYTATIYFSIDGLSSENNVRVIMLSDKNTYKVFEVERCPCKSKKNFEYKVNIKTSLSNNQNPELLATWENSNKKYIDYLYTGISNKRD